MDNTNLRHADCCYYCEHYEPLKITPAVNISVETARCNQVNDYVDECDVCDMFRRVNHGGANAANE